jgi:hypothetical protein
LANWTAPFTARQDETTAIVVASPAQRWRTVDPFRSFEAR